MAAKLVASGFFVDYKSRLIVDGWGCKVATTLSNESHYMNNLERDLERRIEWDCTQLLHHFYGLLDEKRYAEMVELFVPEGVWVRLGEELQGPKAILAAMDGRHDWLTAHVVTNIRVTVVSEDEVNTVQYVTLYRQEGHDPASGPAPVVPPLGLLRHADRLVRRDGKWKFLRKTSRALMTDRVRVTHYDKPTA